jgi:hypothetical protein
MIQLTLYECITIHGSKLNDNKIETTNTKLLAQMVNEVSLLEISLLATDLATEKFRSL